MTLADPKQLARELELALELATLAETESLHRYEQGTFTIDRKADRTEVTEADRAAEARISERLAASARSPMAGRSASRTSSRCTKPTCASRSAAAGTTSA